MPIKATDILQVQERIYQTKHPLKCFRDGDSPEEDGGAAEAVHEGEGDIESGAGLHVTQCKKNGSRTAGDSPESGSGN